jgi:hypothetical protein
MDEGDGKIKKRMDFRCPLALLDFPKTICPLAVERLQALKEQKGNVLHHQEDEMGGCPHYINDKESNYCFFKYIHDNEGKIHSNVETADKMMLTQASIYSAYTRGLEFLSESDLINDLKEDFIAPPKKEED